MTAKRALITRENVNLDTPDRDIADQDATLHNIDNGETASDPAMDARTVEYDPAVSLRERRWTSGLSIRQLAELTGIHRGRLSVLERGVPATSRELNLILDAIDAHSQNRVPGLRIRTGSGVRGGLFDDAIATSEADE